MTLKTSCSKTPLLRKTVSRFWPLWLGYLAVLLLALPLGLYNDLQFDDYITNTDIQRYLYNVTQAGAVITFLMAPLTAMCVFGHLYNDRNAGAYASLPVTRENAFLSCSLAGLIPQLSAIVLTALVTAGVEASFGLVDITSLLTFIGIFCLHTITFYGFAVFCAQLTGAILVVPAVYAVLQFTALAVQGMVQVLVELFFYGYSYSSLDLAPLSPLVNIIQNVDYTSTREVLADGSSYVTACTFSGWGISAIYAAAGLLCLVGAFFLYRNRRMESAGDFVAYRPLKPVFKWALGAGCGLVLCAILISMFEDGRTQTILGMHPGIAAFSFLLTGSFVGFFGAEMLMKKTFRVFEKKAWKSFGIFAAVTALLLSSIVFDFYGYETRVPKAEKVESVVLFTQGDTAILESTDNIETVTHIHEGAIATEKENIAVRLDNWQNTDYTSHYFTITYLLKNGKTLERHYNLHSTGNMLPVLRDLEDVMNCPEAIASRIPQAKDLESTRFRFAYIHYNVQTGSYTQLPPGSPMPTMQSESLGLTAKEAYDLYINCILPDVQDHTIGTVWFTEDSPYHNDMYSTNIELEIQRDDGPDELGRDCSYYYFCPTTESHRTNAWLKARGIPTLLQTEVDDFYQKQHEWELQDFNPNSAEGASSVGIIGGADGPTSIVVAQ